MTDMTSSLSTHVTGDLGPPRSRPPAGKQAAAPSLGRLLRGPMVFGLVVAGLFFGGLGLWAATAPLVSGAIASGVVSPDSSRKLIQHYEGGIIQSVLVRENQRVSAGDLLMTLDQVRAQADLASQRVQWARLVVTRARLAAEAAGLESWEVPAEVADIDDADFLDFITSERRAFETRTLGQDRREQSVGQRIEQLQSEIAALEAQSEGMRTQLALVNEDLPNKQRLFEQRLLSRTELLSMQMQAARLESDIAANAARIAQAGQSIEETRFSFEEERQKYLEGVAQQTGQVNDAIARLEEGMRSAGAALTRTDIRSPVDGIVLNLQAQTSGAVVRPGETIMEVVPLGEELIIIARLAPKDIDLVEPGLKAQVTLVPFASRNMLPLNGEVVAVAADSKLDEVTGMHYYEVRVSISPEELARHEGVYLSPGMPADVTVVTGERTMLHYLFDPVLRSLGSAFVYD